MARSATASLNIIFLFSVDFVLLDLVLLTWGVDCSAVSLLFHCLISDLATFVMIRWLIDEYRSLDLLNKSILARKKLRYYLTFPHIMWKLGWLWSILSSYYYSRGFYVDSVSSLLSINWPVLGGSRVDGLESRVIPLSSSSYSSLL